MHWQVALLLVSLASSTLAGSATQIWNFTTYVDIENSILRPNGQLLFTTLTGPELYMIDPSAASPEAEVVTSMAGTTALTGLAAIDYDKFAVIGGVRGTYNYTNETIYTVDFSSSNGTTIETAITLPDAVMLNGMASLPSNPHVLLVADSRVGCLWRVDLDTSTVTKAVEDDTMLAPTNATVPIGVDGLKITGGYAYFTNVAKLTFARVPIADDGSAATGAVEVLDYLDDDIDDFAVDGTYAYAAQQPSLVVKVDLETGEMVSVLVNDTTMAGGPTSVTLKGDGIHAYLTTMGSRTTGASGQIFEFELSP
ncbi:Six-bladed beta-propeller, TolB-like [Pleurostoma richardsiae]|uniref:Six-bladed beta-propeller, TolB-like n=1 Tax=Pleurostoma richardsiae TaxID=41990 RepID=A0AA38REQ8_9PEZI|nr:Six-bladed beta-propeller, TolB-like [Pleurostoma richardsiae]